MTRKTEQRQTPGHRRVRPRSCANTAPSPAPTSVHGVTHDGQRVWAATGARLIAFDPESGEPTRTLDRACDAGTAFDGTYLYQIAERASTRSIPPPARCWRRSRRPATAYDSGLTWAEGSLWVGQYRDRKIHQIDPATGASHAHHRVQPLRHRRDLGRRRAVARHLGRRRERDPPHRPGERRRARAAGDAAAASASAGSSPTGPISSIAAAATSGKVRAVRRPKTPDRAQLRDRTHRLGPPRRP